MLLSRLERDWNKSTNFLDVMEWQSNADRTNAVAALLTVPFRRHFPGGKPFVLVTASKSHAGKGTLIEFIRGNTEKAEISYEDKDWPMQRNLHDQLSQKPEIGVINFDNVRTDSSGRAKIIRTGFVEEFHHELRDCPALRRHLETSRSALQIDLSFSSTQTKGRFPSIS